MPARSFCASLIAALLAACTGASSRSRVGGAAPGAELAPRLDLGINDGWAFERSDPANAEMPSSDDSAWQKVSLPHTWNAQDGEIAEYYRGVGWYRRPLSLPSSYSRKRIYLQFDGAFLVTDVYVNGTHIGQHRGGFAAFRFDITSAVRTGATNLIAVKVDNSKNPSLPPLEGDFTCFGGLYRDVHLLVVDPVHIELEDFGSSGVYLTPSEIGPSSAKVRVLVKLKNADHAAHTVQVSASLKEADGTRVAVSTETKQLGSALGAEVSLKLSVPSPRLWDGLSDPYLYRVEVTLSEGGTVRDAVTEPLGLRSFRVDPNTGFWLNGRQLDLHGVNRHQDRPGKGWAISPADQDQDLAFIKELGANAVRLVHYQHARYFHDLCDKTGLVVWAELSLVNQITNSPEFAANARQQLTELIRQNYNHPSIFFWGLENELLDNHTDPNPLIAELNGLAHAEDPSRSTTVAANLGDDNPINWHSELVGFNKYYGWYYGANGDIGAWADEIHAAYPQGRIAVSEFGAGAGITRHALPPSPGLAPQQGHSEEYQALFHEQNWKALAARPFVWGKFVWQLFDSASAGRDETANGADARGINDKGLVTLDRATKKDAFYWYKANWSREPFVYITGRRARERTTALTSIKVYSNLEAVELTVNGASLGAQTSRDHIFTWEGVPLAPGENALMATARTGDKIWSDRITLALAAQPSAGAPNPSEPAVDQP
jgi:beta-galactosidase